VNNRTLRSALRNIFHRSGGLHVARYRHRRSLRILMYHHFKETESEQLEAQCRYIRKYYNPVSLDEGAALWSQGKLLPPFACGVTVDDGYLDFYRNAYPIFRQYGIPVTVYLVTDFLDTRIWLWVDRVGYVLDRSSLHELSLPLSSGVLRLALRTAEERRAAVFTTVEALKIVPDEERRRCVAELPRLGRTAVPQEPPEEYAALSWTQVRTMARHGVTFGAHTVTHPLLSRIPCEAQLREEIELSKRRIEDQLQQPVLHFCYPNGRCEDFDERAVTLAKNARFQTAVTTIPGVNVRGDDFFRWKRLAVTPSYSPYYFQQCAAAFRV
jgi:peptidoglycan/xylan/chitin deacetylase (PgdA/CDA1 family)